MTDDILFRQYEPDDAGAVAELDGWAMRVAGTDPTDIPGHGDVERVDSVYLDSGGTFLVGVGAPAGGAGGSGGADSRHETVGGLGGVGGGVPPKGGGSEEEGRGGGGGESRRVRVAPPLQGRGYGTVLLEALEERARRAGFSCVLATTAQRQGRALTLYSGAGYEQVDSSVYGEYDLVHFEKCLMPTG